MTTVVPIDGYILTDQRGELSTLGIPALLISQFDAVNTWIGDHDRRLQLH